jgi:hypothetical protein
MEGNSAAVSGMRPPRFERNRGRGFVGCGVAVLAAVLCASLYTAPARGDDPPSPVPDGSAMTTDSTPSDAAATAPSDVIAPTETSDTSAPTIDSPGTADATDTPAPAPDATDTTGTMLDGSVAAANTAGAGTPAPDATDTSATTAPNPIDTSAATTPDTIATPATTTDNSAAAPDTTGTCALVPDASATSATTTDTSAAAADTTATCAPAPVPPTDTTDGLTATDPSASSPDASAVGPTDAAADSFTITTDPTGTATGTAPATDTRSLSSSGSSGVAEPPASPPGSSSHPPSDATTSDALSEATSNDEDADADSFPGDLVQPFATAVHHGEAMTLIFAVIEIRCGADCRITIVCDPSPRSLPLASCSTKPEATRAGRIEVRTNGPENRRPAGARGPSAPRLPIPDHEPQMPTPPGASSGSGSSGGPHGGSTIGVTSAVLGITPRDGTRPIALIELCRRALPLAFLLDRPG